MASETAAGWHRLNEDTCVLPRGRAPAGCQTRGRSTLDPLVEYRIGRGICAIEQQRTRPSQYALRFTGHACVLSGSRGSRLASIRPGQDYDVAVRIGEVRGLVTPSPLRSWTE